MPLLHPRLRSPVASLLDVGRDRQCGCTPDSQCGIQIAPIRLRTVQEIEWSPKVVMPTAGNHYMRKAFDGRRHRHRRWIHFRWRNGHGVVSLLAGAAGVLSELKSALNTIWRTEEPSDVKEILKKNILFLGLLLGIGFLLTVSLIMSAAVAGLGQYFGGFLPAPEFLLQSANFVLSIGVVTVLFAAMYRFLPNTPVDWHDVWSAPS